MQAGKAFAQRSKIDPHIGTHPSMGAVAARFRGPNDPTMPAFVGMADPNLFFADGRLSRRFLSPHASAAELLAVEEASLLALFHDYISSVPGLAGRPR